LERHDCFIGRWVTFHLGHEAIIKKVYEKNKRPILVLVMDTIEIPLPYKRMMIIHNRLNTLKIPHAVRVIPPIASFNYGRRVGYDINYVEVDKETQKISGTEIRKNGTVDNFLPDME